MATLQERIKKIQEYFKSMEVMENLLIIKVQYGNKWQTYPSDASEEPKIKVAQSEDIPNEWYYYADADKTDYNECFDLIENTIQTNLNTYAKINLLKIKIEELKELFATSDLEKLERIQFIFAPKAKKRKQVKKTIKKEEITPQNENNDEELKEEITESNV